MTTQASEIFAERRLDQYRHLFPADLDAMAYEDLLKLVGTVQSPGHRLRLRVMLDDLRSRSSSIKQPSADGDGGDGKVDDSSSDEEVVTVPDAPAPPPEAEPGSVSESDSESDEEKAPPPEANDLSTISPRDDAAESETDSEPDSDSDSVPVAPETPPPQAREDGSAISDFPPSSVSDTRPAQEKQTQRPEGDSGLDLGIVGLPSTGAALPKTATRSAGIAQSNHFNIAQPVVSKEI